MTSIWQSQNFVNEICRISFSCFCELLCALDKEAVPAVAHHHDDLCSISDMEKKKHQLEKKETSPGLGGGEGEVKPHLVSSLAKVAEISAWERRWVEF